MSYNQNLSYCQKLYLRITTFTEGRLFRRTVVVLKLSTTQLRSAQFGLVKAAVVALLNVISSWLLRGLLTERSASAFWLFACCDVNYFKVMRSVFFFPSLSTKRGSLLQNLCCNLNVSEACDKMLHEAGRNRKSACLPVCMYACEQEGSLSHNRCSGSCQVCSNLGSPSKWYL